MSGRANQRSKRPLVQLGLLCHFAPTYFTLKLKKERNHVIFQCSQREQKLLFENSSSQAPLSFLFSILSSDFYAEEKVEFPVLCHWSPEAVGGPRAAESHSCAGLLPGQRCPPSAGQQPYPALYPTTLLSPEKQPLTARNFRLTPRGGGRGGGERKRPGNLVDRELGKEWQNPVRLQHCDGKKRFSWVGEKGRGEFSRMLKLLWDFSAQKLRAGKTTLSILKLGEIALNVHCGVFQLCSASNVSAADKEITVWSPLEKLQNSSLSACPTVISCLFCLGRRLFPSLYIFFSKYHAFYCFICMWKACVSVVKRHSECVFDVSQTVRSGCVRTAATWSLRSGVAHFTFPFRAHKGCHTRCTQGQKKGKRNQVLRLQCSPGVGRCVTQMPVVSGVLNSGIFLMVLIESGRSDPFSAKVTSRDPESGLGCGVLSFTFLHPEFFSAPSLLTLLSLQRGTPFTPPPTT